jgi:hypothetical protein
VTVALDPAGPGAALPHSGRARRTRS